MFKNLLYKEFKLSLHPTSLIFFALSAMLLIPNYPYYVVFFYACLGVFFMCLQGRENHDISYSLLLPIEKKDIVKARISAVVLIELAQMIFAIPFMLIRGLFPIPGNQVGMDANWSLLGLSFIMLGLFNLIYFTYYYKHPQKVGTAFAWGSLGITLFMIVAESTAHAVPFVVNVLDGPNAEHTAVKLITLVVGLFVFSAMTYLAYKKSARSFETLDL